MKTLRRLLSSLLCLLLCAALLPAAAAEGAADNAVIASGSCGESARWTLSSEGVLSISGTGKMSWNGSCPWGDYRTDVKSVVIGSGITSILGFDQCPNLKSVTIPASVTELRDGCFAGSGALKSVELPSGIVAIPGNCFCGCASLTNVTIPSGVKSIGMYAFAFCGSLTGLTLPSGLQIIGEAAFTGSGALTGLTIPSKVTQIGQRAFLDCGALSAIKVSSYNQNYSASNGVLFNKDKSILIAYPGGKSGDYSFPGTVSSICPFAFAGCRKLGHRGIVKPHPLREERVAFPFPGLLDGNEQRLFLPHEDHATLCTGDCRVEQVFGEQDAVRREQTRPAPLYRVLALCPVRSFLVLSVAIIHYVALIESPQP